MERGKRMKKNQTGRQKVRPKLETRRNMEMDRSEETRKSASEFFEAFVNSQREFLEGWMKTQKDMLDNWLEATRKFQEAFLNLGGTQEGGRDYMKMYNAWLSTLVNSSKIYTDEISKMQEKWRSTVDKETVETRG
jgi:hypothetical protein